MGPLTSPAVDSGAWVDWVARQGDMGARTATFPWTETPLGPIQGWSAPLRAAVSLCLGSSFPMTLWWGPELVVLPNEAARQVFGDDRFAAALGRGVAEVWPDTLPRIRSEMDDLFGSGRPFFAANSLTPFDRQVHGEECYLTYSYTPILDETNQIVGVLCIFIETTTEILDRRRLATLADLARELAVPASEAEVAQTAMTVLARDVADHPAAALYRVPANREQDPVLVAAFGEPEVCESVAVLIRRCLESGDPQHGAGDCPPVGGWHAYPLVDPERGLATHIVVVGHHQQRPWDEALARYLTLVAGSVGTALLTQAELWSQRQVELRLRSLDEVKTEYFAALNHDLRTPLTLISAPLDQVLEGSRLDEESRALLTLARRNVARLTTMAEAMLEVDRLDADRLQPTLVPTDVTTLTAGLAASFAPVFDNADLEFRTRIAALSRPAMLDPDLFERIVSNLLSNALKFTPAGGVQLIVAEDADDFLVSVVDTGLGIQEPEQERVFARYERLPPQPGGRPATGAGLGLAIARQFAGLLGGSIDLESAPGRGSTFTVRLPFDHLQAASRLSPGTLTGDLFIAEVEKVTEPIPGADQASGHLPWLLIVEDDAQLAKYLADSLADQYRITVAPNGSAALAAIGSRRPDLVLSDAAMPALDGLEMVKVLRADPGLRDVPVVMLSARAGAESSAAGLEAGADDYVTKPFTMLDLRSRLAANLARARNWSGDTAWRQALLTSMHDPMIIFDLQGTVLEINQAFTDLFGYRLDTTPITPPYPWWPTAAEDADGLAGIRARHDAALAGVGGLAEFRYFDSDRRPVWVSSADAQVRNPASGEVTNIRTFRDITAAKQAEVRRAAGARVSAEFSHAQDLATLLAAAEHGFELLFEGTATIEIAVGAGYLFSGGRTLLSEDLTGQARAGLAGQPSADAVSLRPGILLVPATSNTGCRVWVDFPRPRRITPNEMIVADLLAQAFSLAVDRLVDQTRAADKQANLEQAIESHRLIGQAVGILVERHRIQPAQAFDQLRHASQTRNLKIREIAARIIETGAEPDQA